MTFSEKWRSQECVKEVDFWREETLRMADDRSMA